MSILSLSLSLFDVFEIQNFKKKSLGLYTAEISDLFEKKNASETRPKNWGERVENEPNVHGAFRR